MISLKFLILEINKNYQIPDEMKSGNLTGPHSGKEVDLLITGKKPVAIINLPEDLSRLIPYIRHGKLVAKKLKYDNYSYLWSVVVAQPKEKWRIDKIIHLVNHASKVVINHISHDPKFSALRYHAKLGLLLGYSKEEVKHFLKKIKLKLGLVENVEKYLIWEPTGDFRLVVNELNKLQSQSDEVYRAFTNRDVSDMKRDGVFQSKGKGNTRSNAGTYVASDIHLAGAFALRYLREGYGGYIVVMDKNKMPELISRDPGNFTTEQIPIEAVKRIINLQDFTGR